jgi:myo-inositol 2-dehydrogenase / D-chiro-inositol 1-dehydrogenase
MNDNPSSTTSEKSSSRRGFLNAATAAFTIVAPQAVRGSQANSKVSVALIGTGNRGSYDAGIAHRDPRARVTVLCDKFDDRMEAAQASIKIDNPTRYRDFEKVLASPDVDAVIIATPPFEHPRMFEAAVQARKHMYCEKPMGVDVAGAKRIIAASRKADKTKCVSVGYQQRYGPVYLEAFKRIKAGEIGDVSNARAFWIAADPFKRVSYPDPAVDKLRNWFAYKELSGDIIVEQDCHNFDVLHWFLDAVPVRAIGYGGKKVRKDMDILDHLTVAFEFPGGMMVNYEANQLTPRVWTHVGEEFTGTKGFIAVSRKMMQHYKAPKEVETMESKRDITMDAIENFIGRIVNNDPENVGERSAHSTLIAILGRTAIYKGREATWKGDIGV